VVFSLHDDGSIRGAWAHRHGTKLGMRWIKLPVLTPFTAIWIGEAEERSPQKDIAHRHEVLADLERQLPQAQIVELKLPWTFQDWLPMYWKGYREETRYTFRFPEINMETIHEGFSKSFRRNLRAAERHYTIEDGNVSDLYTMMERVFEMRDAPYCSEATAGRLCRHCRRDNNAGSMPRVMLKAYRQLFLSYGMQRPHTI
jgi:hypothetical protein